MIAVVLALGSNLGDRKANLAAAVEQLTDGGVVIGNRSSVWETPPVPADQPPFLNAVVVGETVLSAPDVLALAKRIEATLGRRPGRRWGPRPIDVDLLFYNETSLNTPDLVIPHPRISERAFVLAPLSEALAGPLPILGETALALLAALPPEATEGMRRVGALGAGAG